MEQSDRPNKTEDQFTKTIEDYTAAIPSSTYLAVAIGAMVLSLMCQATGQGKWGNFIAQWVPTWLIIGVYNKLVNWKAMTSMIEGGNGNLFIDRIHNEHRLARLATDESSRAKEKHPWQIGKLL